MRAITVLSLASLCFGLWSPAPAAADGSQALHQKATRLLEKMNERERAVRNAPPPRTTIAPASAPEPPPPIKLYVGPVITAEQAFALGQERMLERSFAAAIPLFRHALELDREGQAVAHKFLGIAHARIGDKCQASYHYQTYVELLPDASDAPTVKRILDMFWRAPSASADCD